MFAYCGNSSVNCTDPAGTFHRSFTAQIDALFYEGSGGIAGLGGSTHGTRNSGSTIKNYIYNEDESKVLKAQDFTFYKGVPVIKVPGNSAFSFGVIFFGDDIHDENLVRHEYGHIIQLQKLGVSAYLNTMVVPSVIGFNLDKMGVLPDGMYYNQPWEYKADEFGRVTWGHASWASTIADIYWGIAVILSYTL